MNNTYLNIQLKEKQYRQQNAELTALQLQINPHFLYNTLQTLDMEARKLNDDGRISAVVGYVSDILKYSLTNPPKERQPAGRAGLPSKNMWKCSTTALGTALLFIMKWTTM